MKYQKTGFIGIFKVCYLRNDTRDDTNLTVIYQFELAGPKNIFYFSHKHPFHQFNLAFHS